MLSWDEHSPARRARRSHGNQQISQTMAIFQIHCDHFYTSLILFCESNKHVQMNGTHSRRNPQVRCRAHGESQIPTKKSALKAKNLHLWLAFAAAGLHHGGYGMGHPDP